MAVVWEELEHSCYIIFIVRRARVPGGWLVLEAAPVQFNKLYALMDQAGFHSIDVERDLAGRDRVMAGRLDRPAQIDRRLWGFAGNLHE